jgi:hypothetical protein
MLVFLAAFKEKEPSVQTRLNASNTFKKMRNLCNLIYLGWLLLACSGTGIGSTIVASGCSGSQVQSAIDAAGNGDTVQVPAGSATWTSSVLVTGKSITLQGAGVGQTVITRNTAANSDAALVAMLSPGYRFTLSGFTFSTVNLAQWGIVNISGTTGGAAPSGAQFRITNCRINVAPTTPDTGFRGIQCTSVYGVIDHCYIYNSSSNGQGISIGGNNSWNQTNCPTYSTPQSLGDTNAVVIEDCTFDFADLGDGALDSYVGTKFVFRHNTVMNTNVGWHGADSAFRSCRSFEIYQNTFQASIVIYTAIRARGGTGVVWGNTIAGLYRDFFTLSHYRADPAYNSSQPPGLNIDGNFDTSGYPLLDQIGRGSFPTVTPWPNQLGYTQAQYESLDPMYQWGNNFKGSTSPTCTVDLPPQSATYIKPDRDYYDNRPKPGYVALTYPHPLVTGAPLRQSSASSPPRNLRIQ